MNSRMDIAVPSVGLVPVATLYSCGSVLSAVKNSSTTHRVRLASKMNLI